MSEAILVIILGLVALVASQAGSYDYPCDPNAPVDECQVNLHLHCSPLFNHYSEGTCRCHPGSFWHYEGLYRCRVGADMPCSTAPGSAACTGYATCRSVDGDPSKEVCACNEGFYPQAPGFYCVRGHGERCMDESGEIARCDGSKWLYCGYEDGQDPSQRTCKCTNANIWSEARGKCVATVESASSCSVNDDCVDNAYCRRPPVGIARCHCAPGFTKNADNTCSLEYGATCDPAPNASVKCNEVEGLWCSASNNTCVCGDGRELSYGNVCLGLAGHDCTTHQQCAGGALCHQQAGKCFCAEALGNIELVDRTCGRLGRGGYCRLGDMYQDCPASEYLQCTRILGVPTYGRCDCDWDAGFVKDENGRCIQVAGGTCGVDGGNQNCVPNAACVANVCTCLPGTVHTADNRCVRSYGQACTGAGVENQCHAELGLTCVSGSCACMSGQEWSESRQHCVALALGSCSPSTDYCTANSTCSVLGFCECDAGYAQRSPEDRHCVPSHGTACHPTAFPCNENQFLSCPGPGSQCTCEFPAHQLWDANRGQCVSVLGSPCGTLDEHGGRELQCIETSVCKVGADFAPKCACDEENGVEPDGQGKCRSRDDPTTTTVVPPPPTTTAATTTTPGPTPTPTTGPSSSTPSGSRALGASACVVIFTFGVCTWVLNTII